MTRSFATNLRCGSCVATIKPVLDQEPGIQRWEADTTSPDKTLRIEGDISITRLNQLLEPLGYKARREIEPAVSPPLAPEEPVTSYFPLALILAYLLGILGMVEYAHGSWSTERAMRHFMAGFFLVFSFFKLLNGVVESLLNKRKIRCACLGTVFKLPMSVVTLVEDTLMVAMALAMLFMAPASH